MDGFDIKSVSPQPGRPLYVVVKEAVRDAIDRGYFRPGDQLPSTKAMSEKMQVSLVTMHRAMQELVTSGVLRRGQGRGTFVHEDFATRGKTAQGYRVGLVFHQESSLADSYHGQILEGVRQGADELGVDLVLLRFGEDVRNECQGYLFVNPLPDQLDRPLRFGRQTRVANEGLPVIVVGARVDRPGWCAVDSDNRGMGRTAVHHFAKLGHRRLGYVGGLGQVSNDADRWEGFSRQCEIMSCQTPLVLRSPSWRLDDAAVDELARRLRSTERPTAILAAGYYFALNVYDAARRAGLSIPDDLAVIGVDDPPSAQHLSPSLTTFRQPLLEMGRRAISELFDLSIKGIRPPQQTTLVAEFLERSSTAGPVRA